MSILPLDVIAGILCRLAIDCVLRFRCVSKSWRALIDTPEFANLHLNHSLKTNSNRWVILRETEDFGYKKHCFYCVNIDSLNSRTVTPKHLDNPLSCCEFDTRIVGSCNGLLLISNYVHETAVWNPSTGKYIKLPFAGLIKDNGHIRFGFGYDVVNDDYKVVRIAQFFDPGVISADIPLSQVNVFSLKSKSWKKVVEEVPYYIRNKGDPGTYLNGALHWVVGAKISSPYQHFHKWIATFDLSTEKFGLVPHPPHIEHETMKLVVLGGFLCALYILWDDCGYDEWGNPDALDHIDIWAMKEYGVQDSWTKVKSIERLCEDIGRTAVPLAYSNNGGEILVEQDHKRFIWTSIKGGSTKIIDTQFGTMRGFLHFNSFVYLGSLVQLSSTDTSSSDDRSYLKKQCSQDKGGQKKASKKRGDGFLSKGFKLNF